MGNRKRNVNIATGFADEAESQITQQKSAAGAASAPSVQVEVPIGTILPWHGDLSGVPVLPDEFLECNGQTVDDSESLLDGVTLPDLNVGSGTGRFLRGSTGTTGTTQASQNISHNHGTSESAHRHTPSNSWKAEGTTLNSWRKVAAGATVGTGTALPPTASTGLTISNDGASEARPINMTIKWIIRIK